MTQVNDPAIKTQRKAIKGVALRGWRRVNWQRVYRISRVSTTWVSDTDLEDYAKRHGSR